MIEVNNAEEIECNVEFYGITLRISFWLYIFNDVRKPWYNICILVPLYHRARV